MYANVTTRKLIIHLYAKYGNITMGALNDNKQRTKTAYDTIKPIKTLYTQMEQAIDFFNEAFTLFTPSQIFAMAYNLVFKTRLYNDTCCKWRCLLLADGTWENFQADYSSVDQDLRKSQLTAQSAR